MEQRSTEIYISISMIEPHERISRRFEVGGASPEYPPAVQDQHRRKYGGISGSEYIVTAI